MKCREWTNMLVKILPFCIVTSIVTDLLHDHFVLSGLRLPLDPQYYNVEVITREEYQSLPQAKNGMVTVETPSMYQPVNEGSQYALVTMNGVEYARHESRGLVWSIFTISLLALLSQLVTRVLGSPLRIAAT
jgi:hypothetical protein